MNDRQHIDLLQQQINLYKKENRHLEFKSNHLDSERLGRYISALSNGACLDNKDNGYLYFGVEDGTLELKGTTFDASRTKAKGNQDLEIYLRQYVSPKIDFKIEAFKDEDGKRFVVFIIPAAKEEPTCFMGIPDNAIAKLRKEKLIEGRKGSLFIGKRVATATHQEAEYIDLKGFDDQYYRDLIVKALSEHDNLKRADFDKLLLSKLPKSLNPKQKTNKIDRLLRSLRSNGKIFADEHRIWYLRTV